jgi:hypothetical protein
MKKWTLMVYISADDVLVNFAVESLKQLKQAANENIQVFAEFDQNVKEQEPRLYLFNGSKKKDPSIESNRLKKEDLSEEDQPRFLGPKVDMADPKHLTDFINVATAKCGADHYGLVLWGHGPELLFDDDVPAGTPARLRYLTPANLGQALQSPEVKLKAKLDIVAIDACCGALVEVASVLKDRAKYLIASQDEVPDASLPYKDWLTSAESLFKAGEVKELSKAVPKAYGKAFLNYIPTAANELRGITLSTVDLDKIDDVAAALAKLATSLLEASNDATLRRRILEAREKSKAFEFGLFVDLVDFCEHLAGTGDKDDNLTSGCMDMKDAIYKNLCVIANKATFNGEDITTCHGLSIYFPYKTKDPIEGQIIEVKNGTNYPTKNRIDRITEFEQDYDALKMLEPWMQFIKGGWSVILAKALRGQGELDTHYSAQQCAKNLVHDDYQRPDDDRQNKEFLRAKVLQPKSDERSMVLVETAADSKQSTEKLTA